MSKIAMTPTWVHKIKSDKFQEDGYDLALDRWVSLVLRVSRSGAKIWQVIYRPKGEAERKRFKIGEYPDMPLAHARGRAYAIRDDLKAGGDPAARREAAKAAPTFGAIAKEYLERYAMKQKRSWEQDQRMLSKDLLPAWENRKAHEIKRRDVIALLDGIAERGAPITANHTLARARKIFNWAISRDLLQNNPCLQVKPVASENQRDRVLTEDEIRKVCAAFDVLAFTEDGKESPLGAMMEQVFKLRLITAQRGGKVESMAWADVDLAGGWWTIPADRATNGLSHRVPLSASTIVILE